jgi:hypothetical protein
VPRSADVWRVYATTCENAPRLRRLSSTGAKLEALSERPTSGGTIHPDHGRDLQTLLSQSRYHEEIQAAKARRRERVEWRPGQLQVGKISDFKFRKTRDFKFRKSVEPPPPPAAPAPNDDARAGGHDHGSGSFCCS